MTENYQNNNIQTASGIWQTTWGTLFKQFNELMIINNYQGAWKTLEILTVELPPECEEAIKEEYLKTEAIINKQFCTYTSLEANRQKKHQLSIEAPKALLTLMGKIRFSLYDKKWITKDLFTATPRNQNIPHIGR